MSLRLICVLLFGLAISGFGQAADKHQEEKLRQWVKAYLRCDQNIGSALRVAQADLVEGLDEVAAGFRFHLNADIGQLPLQSLTVERNQTDDRVEVRWNLRVLADPEQTYSELSPMLPPDGAPMQTLVKRKRTTHVRMETSFDAQNWKSIPVEEAQSLMRNPGGLSDRIIRILYFGRINRATSTDGRPQTNSVLTSVQCVLVTDAPTLAGKLNEVAGWPTWLE